VQGYRRHSFVLPAGALPAGFIHRKLVVPSSMLLGGILDTTYHVRLCLEAHFTPAGVTMILPACW